MELCSHIVEIYKHEIIRGNEVVFVSAPDPDDKYSHAKLVIMFSKPLDNYSIPNVNEESFIDTHYPQERYYICSKCAHVISGPIEANQVDKYVRDLKFNKPKKEIIAYRDNVYVEDNFYGKFLIPIDKWK